MRPITVWTLCLLAIAAVAGSIYVVSLRQATSHLAKAQLLFPALGSQLDRAASIEIARHDGTVVFKRKDGVWVSPAKGDYPIKPKPVHETLAALASLETIDAKTRQPSLYARLDLDDVTIAESKAVLLTVKDGSGATLASVLVGKLHGTSDPADPTGDSGASVYVRKPGDAQSWLARGSFDLAANASDWFDHAVVDVPQDQIAHVSMKAVDGKVFDIARDKPEDQAFALTPIPAGMAIKSQYDVNALANTLEGLSFEDVQPASNLTVPADAAGAEFRTFKGMSVSATVVPKDQVKWVILQASGSGDEASKAADAFNAKAKGWAFVLPSTKQGKLDTTLDKLVEPAKKPVKPAS